jgi:hypothetical protein
VIPAHRHQPAFPARVAGAHLAVLAALGGCEPGVAVAAQHRPRTRAVQFPERARPGGGQFPAQLLVGGQRRVPPASPPRGQFQGAAPHVAGRAQQPEHPIPLMPGHPQPAPCGAVHDPRRFTLTFSRHEIIMPKHTDKTTNATRRARAPVRHTFTARDMASSTSTNLRRHPLSRRPRRSPFPWPEAVPPWVPPARPRSTQTFAPGAQRNVLPKHATFWYRLPRHAGLRPYVTEGETRQSRDEVRS